MVLLPASAVGAASPGRARPWRGRRRGGAGVAMPPPMRWPPPTSWACRSCASPPQSSLIEVERAIISLIVDRESQVRRRVEQIYERLLATLVDDGGIRRWRPRSRTWPAGRPSSWTSIFGSRSPCPTTRRPAIGLRRRCDAGDRRSSRARGAAGGAVLARRRERLARGARRAAAAARHAGRLSGARRRRRR